jgi:hypothetical protein
MTLIITVLTKQTIYQSADFRLTDAESGQPFPDTSTKLVTLHYGEWDGFVAYTGIGRWEKRGGTPLDTSDFVVQWLEGLYPATPADVAGRVRDRATNLLSTVKAEPDRKRLTFILAAFVAGTPQLAIISNFEDCCGRNDAKAEPQFTVSNMRFRRRPRIVVSGWKPAVSPQERRLRERIIHRLPDDPARVRRMLAEINAEAARSPEAQDMISPECSVVSVRADGQGRYDANGPVVSRSLAMGTRLPDTRELAKLMGFDLGQMKAATFASSRPRMPYAQCQPRTITPAGAGGYVVREAWHEDFAFCRADDVSDAGVVLGIGERHIRPDHHVWTAPLGGEPKPCGFIGELGGINAVGEIAARVMMSDGLGHAVRWREGAITDLGVFRGNHAGATAINSEGLVAGRVCADSTQRGQSNWRPAAWAPEELHVLEDFGCDWGLAVDVSDEGIVLVRGHVGRQCRAILWNPLTGKTDLVGGMAGIWPLAITIDGIVLGTSLGRDESRVAFLAKPGQPWERLGTAAGLHAWTMNDAGDVVGHMMVEGYDRPWLRRSSGEILWLPYFNHHHCRPAAINRLGTIVGRATTDHGSHALIWTRSL